MTATLHTGPWSIAVPAQWTVTGTRPSIALIPPDRSAVLQISAYTRDSGDIAIEDMRQMADHDEGAGVPPSPVRCGDFKGYTRDSEHHHRCWRKWWLVAGSHHVFVTWDCATADRDIHRDVVNWIVDSLRLTQRNR